MYLTNPDAYDVFSNYPSLTRTMRALTTDTRKVSELPFLFQECYKAPSIKEIKNYIDTTPDGVGLFKLNYNYDDYSVTNDMLTYVIHNEPWFNHKYFLYLYYYKLKTKIKYKENENGPTWIKMMNVMEREDARNNIYELPEQSDDLKNKIFNPTDSNYENIFVDVFTYYYILNMREEFCDKIQNTFIKATKDYFTNTIRTISELPYAIHMLDSYLTINAYLLNIYVPKIIKESFIGEHVSYTEEEDNEVIKEYNSYVEETNDLRQEIIDNILERIEKFWWEKY